MAYSLNELILDQYIKEHGHFGDTGFFLRTLDTLQIVEQFHFSLTVSPPLKIGTKWNGSRQVVFPSFETVIRCARLISLAQKPAQILIYQLRDGDIMSLCSYVPYGEEEILARVNMQLKESADD